MIDTNNTHVAPQVLEQVEQYVATYCPDFADAEMSVQERKPHQLSDETMSKLRQDSASYGSRDDQDSEVRERRHNYVVSPTQPAQAPAAPARPATPAANASPHYTITLRKNVKTESGAWLPRIARFVVDGSGHILKATASKLFSLHIL